MQSGVRIKILASVLAGLIVLISILGVSLTMQNMSSNVGGYASDCIFAKGHTGLCPMKVIDHLASWSRLFIATPVVILMLLSVIIVFLFLDRSTTIKGQDFYVWRFWSRRQFRRQFFDPLFEALRTGLIHPKIYSIIF